MHSNNRYTMILSILCAVLWVLFMCIPTEGHHDEVRTLPTVFPVAEIVTPCGPTVHPVPPIEQVQ